MSNYNSKIYKYIKKIAKNIKQIMQISNNPNLQHLPTTQNKLNCFIIQHPIYCYLQTKNPKTLLIADNTNHIYQFMYPHSNTQLQNIHNGFMQHNNEFSIEIDDLSNHNVLDIKQNNKCKQQQLMYIDVSMRMDVQVTVRKCAVHFLPINNINSITNKQQDKQHIQLLVVIGQNGQAKLWWKYMSKQYKIIYIQYKNQIKKIADYHLHISNNNLAYISLLQHRQDNRIVTHKCIINADIHKQQIVISIKQIQQPKFINIPVSLEHHTQQQYAQFVDKGRIILYNNLLLGIHQEYTIQLQVQQNNRKILFIQFNNNFIIYATSNMLYLFNRNTKIIKKGKSIANICGLWLLHNSQLFVSMTTNPIQLHVYNMKLHLLWSIPLSSIKQPYPIQCSLNTFFQQNHQIHVLDSATMKTHNIDPQTILSSYPNFLNKNQQQKLHQSTTTTLKHRLQILKTLTNYIISKNEIKNDYNSIFRYLENCNIHGVLCDSLRMIDNHINNDIRQNNTIIKYQHQQRILKFAYNLFNQSKYQTHIQTGLQVLLNSCNRLRKYLPTPTPNPNNNNTKIWKDCIKILQQITQNKKIKKLQQQDKNKKLFQLTYQLVHTINSHILRYQNKY